MGYLPNFYQNDGSGECPEDIKRKYTKVVVYLVQQNSKSNADIFLHAVSLLTPQQTELQPSLNGHVTINADEYANYTQNFEADKNTLPADVKNLLNVISFYRFGTYVLPIKNGIPDWDNTENDFSRKTGEKSPIFGRLPTSGEYSKSQIDLIILLCRVPFKNGKIVISYTNGVPSFIRCSTKDRLWLETD